MEFKFKPKPRATITKGLVHREHLDVQDNDMVGQRFIQPHVELTDGKRLKFDEVLGPWYSVIGFQLNPAAGLGTETKTFWDRIETRFIQVNRSRRGFGRNKPLTANGAVCVEDVDNQLGAWFAKARDTVVVVRPDRFIAAITTPERLGAVLTKLAGQLT